MKNRSIVTLAGRIQHLRLYIHVLYLGGLLKLGTRCAAPLAPLQVRPFPLGRVVSKLPHLLCVHFQSLNRELFVFAGARGNQRSNNAGPGPGQQCLKASDLIRRRSCMSAGHFFPPQNYGQLNPASGRTAQVTPSVIRSGHAMHVCSCSTDSQIARSQPSICMGSPRRLRTSFHARDRDT